METEWLRELDGVYRLDELETLELRFAYGLPGTTWKLRKLGLLAGKYASGTADTLEVLDDEESSGVLGSVLEKSDSSLASPTDDEKYPRCCSYGSRFVVYGDI